MPEGPEIRRAADKIARVLEGRQIVDIHFGLDRLKGRERDFHGAEVREIETRGKALLTHFDNELTIYSHNQLYGRWYVVKRDAFLKQIGVCALRCIRARTARCFTVPVISVSGISLSLNSIPFWQR